MPTVNPGIAATTLHEFANGATFPQIFDHLVSASGRRFRSSEPRVDVVETDTTTLFLCNLPGVKRADVSLSVRDGVLDLEGTYGQPHPRPTTADPSVVVVVEERPQGPFHRAFRIPLSLTAAEITATMQDGVLRIEFGKHAAAGLEGERVEIQ